MIRSHSFRRRLAARIALAVSSLLLAVSVLACDYFRPLIEGAGLRLPPLQRALLGLERHPELTGLARLADLPAARGGAA